MIPINKQKEIKKVLGHRYAIDIAEIAQKKGLLNDKGNTYTPNYIAQVLSGRFNNLELLNIIFDEFKTKKRKQKRERKKINNL